VAGSCSLPMCSATRVIQAEWLKPGTHVSSVGYHPPAAELPPALARQHRLFVETLDAFEPTPVGCAELAQTHRDRGTTLGAVALGRAPGRTNESEITVYKAMGSLSRIWLPQTWPTSVQSWSRVAA
jgi:alanine dehydrogenase